MADRTLFTTGYAGFEADTFLWKLGVYGIETVVDVRDSPTSRNPVFAEPRLRPLLEESGFGYVPWSTLGAPASLRRALKQGGSWDEYVRGYRAHLAEREAEIAQLGARGGERVLPALLRARPRGLPSERPRGARRGASRSAADGAPRVAASDSDFGTPASVLGFRFRPSALGIRPTAAAPRTGAQHPREPDGAIGPAGVR